MKIFNIYGEIQTYPFELGEEGRGRWREEIRVDRRIPPRPDGLGEVGYKVFTVGGHSHCVLTKPSLDQRGLLVRIDTKGVYTKGSCGSWSTVSGSTTVLAQGSWATGAAGRTGSGPDDLILVERRAILRVVLSGGSHKGYGLRYVFIDAVKEYVRMMKPNDVAIDIVTGNEPAAAEILRTVGAGEDKVLTDVLVALSDADAID